MRQNMNQKFYQNHFVWIYMVLLFAALLIHLYVPQQESAAADEVKVIPSEAIRLRILANSDSDGDQEVKRAIRDEVNKEITKWVKDLTSIGEAREVITSRLPELEKIAEEELAKQGLDYSAKVEFGDVQFPTKLYGQYLYPAGVYEAVLITLGEGKGANWWCVLFPPLCFLDFSNGAAVSQGMEDAAEPTVDNHLPVEESNPVEEEGPSESTYVEEQEEVEVKFFLKELMEGLL